MADIKVSGFPDLDPQQARKHIAKEWDERKADDHSPGGYGPSVEFNHFNQMLQGRRDRIVSELRELAEREQPIPKSRISDLRQLEALCFEASTSPNSDMRRSGMRELEQGKNPRNPGTTEWKRFENIAKRLNDAEDSPPVKVTAVHHEF